MTLNPEQFLHRLRKSNDYKGQIAHVQQIPAREAEYAVPDMPLPPALADALAAQGVKQLYKHQVTALDAARSGAHFIVTTPTASGKSLCYNAPVLERLLTDSRARALYLFPTKALAQDQSAKIAALQLTGVVSATYDGDTPKEERPHIKRNARLIITNPDMLHVGILPYHTGWAQLFRNLHFVIVDEAHIYRGVFGAHVANVLRRLRRIASAYAARPQFLSASATIANPDALFEKLVGLRAQVIDGNSAPSGKRHFVFWNPPIMDAATGSRRSTNSEATAIFTRLIQDDVRTIAFTRARKAAEILLTYTREALSRTSQPELVKKVTSYRAGYTPQQRRDIERRLFNGELTGVTATNALELGVDIGGVDACVMTGYPGTVASTWQQAGRAGRRNGESLAVLVAANNPLDQFLMQKPEYFFGKSHEHAALDPTNRHILAGHLMCAAHEMPMDDCDLELFGGEKARHTAHALCEQGTLAYRRDRLVYAGNESHPPFAVNIRSASSNQYTILDVSRGNSVLGTVEEAKAFETLHPGAVYLHMGETFVVEDLDERNRRALVRPSQAGYFTEPTINSHIEILEETASKPWGKTTARFGTVVVTSQIVSYKQKQMFTDEALGTYELNLPPTRFETEAVWYTLPNALVGELERDELDLAGGVHAVEHASIGLLPLFALCDRNDIGGVSTEFHSQTGAATIFVHDGHPGGVGIAETGFRLMDDWLRATHTLLKECPCESGCPSCIQSPKCGNNNEPLDKAAAERILRRLM